MRGIDPAAVRAWCRRLPLAVISWQPPVLRSSGVGAGVGLSRARARAQRRERLRCKALKKFCQIPRPSAPQLKALTVACLLSLPMALRLQSLVEEPALARAPEPEALAGWAVGELLLQLPGTEPSQPKPPCGLCSRDGRGHPGPAVGALLWRQSEGIRERAPPHISGCPIRPSAFGPQLLF